MSDTCDTKTQNNRGKSHCKRNAPDIAGIDPHATPAAPLVRCKTNIHPQTSQRQAECETLSSRSRFRTHRPTVRQVSVCKKTCAREAGWKIAAATRNRTRSRWMPSRRTEDGFLRAAIETAASLMIVAEAISRDEVCLRQSWCLVQ